LFKGIVLDSIYYKLIFEELQKNDQFGVDRFEFPKNEHWILIYSSGITATQQLANFPFSEGVKNMSQLRFRGIKPH
jgi:hypothetical protein